MLQNKPSGPFEGRTRTSFRTADFKDAQPLPRGLKTRKIPKVRAKSKPRKPGVAQALPTPKAPKKATWEVLTEAELRAEKRKRSASPLPSGGAS